MATTTVDVQTTDATLDVSPVLVTYGVYQVQVADGTDADGNAKFRTELKTTQKDAEIEKHKEAGTLVGVQSFSYNEAKRIAGIHTIIRDEEEAVGSFNSGLKIRINTRVNALLTELDENGQPAFQGVNGNYDLDELINDPSKRRSMSPLDKAVKTIAALPGMDEATLLEVVARLRAAGQIPATGATE